MTPSSRLLLLALMSVVASGCVAEAGASGSAETSAPLTSAQSPGDCGLTNMSVDYAPFTIASLVRNGATIVEGRVLLTEPSVYNTEDGKKPRGFPHAYGVVNAQPNGTILTPANVMVDRVFVGTVKPGALKVFVEGGTIGCYTLNVDTPGPIVAGSTYVFVLGDALSADGKTWKNQWQVRSRWPVGPDGTVATSLGVMSLDALAAEVNAAASSAATAPPASAP